MALMRGVAIVIEPLLSINTDQAKSASRECPEGIHAFDVDGLQTADANLLIRQLKNLTPSTPSASSTCLRIRSKQMAFGPSQSFR